MSQSPAQRLGKYEIVRELGSGGFATVFLARETQLQREVALKVLRPALLDDEQFVRRFENDARAAARLDHPHIITIHDLGEIDDRLVIAMPYLPGGSVADRIAREGAFPFGDTATIISEVAAALDHAHRAGLVHRDVKPANVLLDERGRAVLSDFGVVRAVEGSSLALTTMGGLIGTPAYMGPELWDNEPAQPATDIYALGCLAYEMLTGVPLFQGDTSAATMRAHFKPPRFPERWPEGVPPGIESVLGRAVVTDPAGRYPSAGALATALRALAEKPNPPPVATADAARSEAVAVEPLPTRNRTPDDHGRVHAAGDREPPMDHPAGRRATTWILVGAAVLPALAVVALVLDRTLGDFNILVYIVVAVLLIALGYRIVRALL